VKKEVRIVKIKRRMNFPRYYNFGNIPHVYVEYIYYEKDIQEKLY